MGGGQGGQGEPEAVDVGRWQGSDWLVSEGLHDGDRVVVDGAITLHAGSPVVVKPGVWAMFSRFFIERPIFAAVVSIILGLAGVVAMLALPIEQYPTITPVQVTVSATYPGADSKTLADSVAAPIEAQINGVDNMIDMSSTSSSTGILTITVYFALDTDPDIAQVQVQNRVNLAAPSRPRPWCSRGMTRRSRRRS